MNISLTDDQPTIDFTTPARSVAWERVGAGAGMLAVLLLGFAFIVKPTPGILDPESPGPLVSQYLVDGRSQARLSMYLLIVGAALLVVFVAHLRRVVEGVEGGRSWTAAVVYGGGLTAAAGVMIFAGLLAATAAISDYGGEDQTARALFALTWSGTVVVIPGLAVLAAGVGLAAIRYDAVPRWAGVIGFPIAVLLVTPWSFVGFVAVWPWLLGLAAELFVRPVRPEPQG